MENYNMKLWFDKPSSIWEEALPVGNGRLGGMIFGGVQKERIQLNEDTLWSGYPKDSTNPKAAEYIEEARKLIFSGEYVKAQKLIENKMLGAWTQSYQPLGNLFLEFEGMENYKEYSRELDIERAVAKTQFKIGDNLCIRETFISAVDQVMVMHLTCSKPRSLTFKISMDSLLKHKTEVQSYNSMGIQGRCPIHVEPSYVNDCENPIIYDNDENDKGMTFKALIKVINQGGKVSKADSSLMVEAADSVIIIFTAATSFNGYEKNPGTNGLDPEQICNNYMNLAIDKSFEKLLQDHICDYQKLYQRVRLDIGITDAIKLPVDERLLALINGREDPHLFSLLFQYGRYLMISSSRQGTQPANLQGIWNHEVRPPWSSNWTTNINAQMNYWPVETCNLSECHEPLIDLIEDLSQAGAITAQVNYNCRGWVVNHNVDLWRQTTAVGGSARWAYWPMAAAWLCQHLWEHYNFSLDLLFLKERAYPAMKGAALFLLDWLIENEDGYLVTCPSTSPENGFITTEGEICSVSLGSTMDISIIREHFMYCIEAAEILEVDMEFRDELKKTIDKLLPFKVGKYGQLQEWFLDFEEEDPKHRHISHLYSLYPGCQILNGNDLSLLEACKNSLNRRGDEGTGWSLAWKINFWARLGDGNRALKLIRRQLKPVFKESLNYSSGGTYPNLFDAHPPFQIDGNFGVTSGIAEMLLQSHSGVIHLLPALPTDCDNGRVSGLCARGGFEVSIKWNNGKLVEARIFSRCGQPCRVRYDGKEAIIDLSKNQVCLLDGNMDIKS